MEVSDNDIFVSNQSQNSSQVSRLIFFLVVTSYSCYDLNYYCF